MEGTARAKALRWGTEDRIAGAKSGRKGGVGPLTTAAGTLALSDTGSPPKVSVDR